LLGKWSFSFLKVFFFSSEKQKNFCFLLKFKKGYFMIAGPIFDEEELCAADEGWLDGLHMLRQEEKRLRKFKENNSKQYQRKQKDKERTLQKKKRKNEKLQEL
jgi:hypothetical protein